MIQERLTGCEIIRWCRQIDQTGAENVNVPLQQKQMDIERTRARLGKLVQQMNGNVHDPAVKALSQQLDVLIVDYLRMKNASLQVKAGADDCTH